MCEVLCEKLWLYVTPDMYGRAVVHVRKGHVEAMIGR